MTGEETGDIEDVIDTSVQLVLGADIIDPNQQGLRKLSMTVDGAVGEPFFYRYIESIGIGIGSRGRRESFALVEERTLVEGQDWVICRHIHRGRFLEMTVEVYTSHMLFRGEEAE
jgi:hypothetical protein